MNKFLSEKKHYVFDGGMGTMLQKYGIKIGRAPEELNLTEPDAVKKIHADYVEAGSDIIQTNTFGGNFFRLKHYGLEKNIYEINKRGIDTARKAAGKNILVALSVGPTGGLLEPYGELTKEEAVESFAKQIKAGDEADFINIETMQTTDEAEAALEAVRFLLPEMPVSVSITYQKAGENYVTLWGESIESVINRFKDKNIQVIGSNCGDGYKQFTGLISAIKEKTNMHILAKPNAGIPVMQDGCIIYPETPEMIEGFVNNLLESGVKIIGGCCGTSPEHIKIIRRITDKYL